MNLFFTIGSESTKVKYESHVKDKRSTIKDTETKPPAAIIVQPSGLKEPSSNLKMTIRFNSKNNDDKHLKINCDNEQNRKNNTQIINSHIVDASETKPSFSLLSSPIATLPLVKKLNLIGDNSKIIQYNNDAIQNDSNIEQKRNLYKEINNNDDEQRMSIKNAKTADDSEDDDFSEHCQTSLSMNDAQTSFYTNNSQLMYKSDQSSSILSTSLAESTNETKKKKKKKKSKHSSPSSSPNNSGIDLNKKLRKAKRIRLLFGNDSISIKIKNGLKIQ